MIFAKYCASIRTQDHPGLEICGLWLKQVENVMREKSILMRFNHTFVVNWSVHPSVALTGCLVESVPAARAGLLVHVLTRAAKSVTSWCRG